MSGKSARRPEKDWWEDPSFKAYAQRCRTKLIPMIESSATAISVVPPDLKTDVKFATELGFMIMFDKPIIAMIPPGTKIPLKLAKVADEIVEGDIDDPTVKDRLMAALRRQQAKLKEEGHED